MQDHIKNYYNSKVELYGTSPRRLQAIINLLPSGKNLRILDIGCGTGNLGRELIHLGHHVHGIDISAKAVKTARKYISRAYELDIETQNIPGIIKYDLVIVSEVIEHLFDPQAVVRKIYRLLKPGGYLIVTTPNIAYWYNRWQFLRGKFDYADNGMFDHGHIHFFTRPSLIRLLKNSGFSGICENHISAGTPGYWMCKILPNLFAYQIVLRVRKSFSYKNV